LAIELHTRSNHLDQGTPQVEAHAWLLPQAKATYLRNTLFHRLYLKVIAITVPHIPQNKFILLNLFSKDPINNRKN
jgi:hypothetical protein